MRKIRVALGLLATIVWVYAHPGSMAPEEIMDLWLFCTIGTGWMTLFFIYEIGAIDKELSRLQDRRDPYVELRNWSVLSIMARISRGMIRIEIQKNLHYSKQYALCMQVVGRLHMFLQQDRFLSYVVWRWILRWQIIELQHCYQALSQQNRTTYAAAHGDMILLSNAILNSPRLKQKHARASL